ncbi:tetratricopeptide repeat protein [Sphingomonas sp. URHD0057]|uniref:tetratricopeptide repeat protein n=1 Tax=Sphingomonas sp. URHD0057 TaxID=1380389 RepID=UPI0004920B6A|nr:tetratricopeptide repeat protein [Sphingomonas sp. URHD0057]
MKALTFCTGTILVAGLSIAPAQASTFSVGSRAATCYAASQSYSVRSGELDNCTAALDQEPLSFEDRVATLVNRGIVRMNLGDNAGADRDFDTALSMDRNEAEAYLNKGLLRLRQDKPSEAMPLIQRAIEAHTIRPALALYARGVAHEMMGDLKAAFTDLSQARDMAPGWKLPAEQLARYRVH